MRRMWALAIPIFLVLVLPACPMVGQDVTSLDEIDLPTAQARAVTAQGGGAFALASYVGGNSRDAVTDVAVDDFGFIYLTGFTNSTDLPVTYSIGPGSGEPYDIFVMKLTPDGKEVLFTTIIGGSETDYPMSIEVDAYGNMIICGDTDSSDLPTVRAYDSTFNSNPDPWENVDGFLLKLAATGDRLVFSTYFGGSDYDSMSYATLDDRGNIYIAGITGSTDLPLENAWDWVLDGYSDVVIAKFTSLGDLVYSTYLGGSEDHYGFSANDYPSGIAVGDDGSVFVVGRTEAIDWPMSDILFGNEDQEFYGFLCKLGPRGDELIFTKMLDLGYFHWVVDVGLTPSGDIVITGSTNRDEMPLVNSLDDTRSDTDIFIMRLDSTGSRVLYSTYFGGSDTDRPNAMAIDSEGNIVVVGYTYSYDYPLVNAADLVHQGNVDAHAFSLTADGQQVRYATFIGGENDDSAYDVTVDSDGYSYAVGYTMSNTWDTYGTLFSGLSGSRDGFLVKLGTPDDLDGDGLSNADESAAGTSSSNPDSDGDSMFDGFEEAYGLNPLFDDSTGNPDGDTLTNIEEYMEGGDPYSTDSDGDTLSDSMEYDTLGTCLFMSDSDMDWLDDAEEGSLGTDPLDYDTDLDLMPDGYEDANGLDPLSDDSGGDADMDSLINLREFELGTDANNADSDGDGLGDYAEVEIYGCDPLNGDTDGDTLGDNEEIVIYGSDPTLVDSDKDGLSDPWEVARGLDPGEFTMDTGQAMEATIFTLAIAGGATIATLVGVEFATRRDGMKKIRRLRFFIPAVVFLLCVLLLAPANMEGPVNPGANEMTTNSASFGFVVSDSPYFTETVWVQVSYYMTVFETEVINVIFYKQGIEEARIVLTIESTSIYQQREYASGTLTLEPGSYNVVIQGRSVRTELEQRETDGRNNDQILWTSIRMGLYAIGGLLFVLAFFVMYREKEPAITPAPAVIGFDHSTFG